MSIRTAPLPAKELKAIAGSNPSNKEIMTVLIAVRDSYDRIEVKLDDILGKLSGATNVPQV